MTTSPGTGSPPGALRAIAGAATLLALLSGSAWLLVQVGSYDIGALANPLTPDDGSLLLTLVTGIGWLAWVAMVLEVVTDLAAGLSRGRLRWRPPTGAWVRPLTHVLVSAVVAGVLAGSMARTAAAPADAAGGAGAPAVMPRAVASAPATPGPSATEQHPDPIPRAATYVVQPGDDLWGIAERELGDGRQWRHLSELNPQVGEHLLSPGTPIAVPTYGDEYHLVTVTQGDSLWTIAEAWLGDGNRWPDIAKANPTLVGDPDEIEIGWVLKVPKAPAPVAEQVPQRAATTERAPDVVEMRSSPGPAGVRTTQPTNQAPTTAQSPQPADPAGFITDDPVRRVTGGITAALAAGITAGLVTRRRQQLLARPLGRQVPQGSSEANRFAQALSRLALAHRPAGTTDDEDAPLTPTTVLVGEADHESEQPRPVLVDLGAHTLTAVSSPSAEVANDFLGGIVTTLMCAEWCEGVAVTVAAEPLSWAGAFDRPELTVVATTTEALELWRATAADRHRLTATGDDSAPEVFVFCDPLDDESLRLLLEVAHPKMCAVVAQRTALASETLAVTRDDAVVASTGQRFFPQLIGEPARRALVELHTVATSTESTPAPWWLHSADDTPAPTPLISRDRPRLPSDDEGAAMPADPRLLLLGPISLVGARGAEPTRAVKQCVEYCAWIHQHPGGTSNQMVAALMVAETTRRSNVSRLRSWLGAGEDGAQYLPEAYTGRISLHPAVSSDWESMQVLLAPGVNLVSSQTLVDALTLVRGAPLADAAPGQWHWAEEMRSDMISTIRDAAVVLGGRALEVHDLDTARWAAHRALLAAPDDELAMGVKIRAEHLSGNRAEVERMVLQVTRQARLLGTDLLDETVATLQEVMEGRPRSRRA
ncbi:LysM peptidoglycan-binding domain-containing protein [Propionibacteriaceae bacterium G1746]|uniref:LysM peptidoglycan-binding domain-containing protein n=1 Tax=Aestuariimicrobium sp. G57 TaxID=3418485 RepID=UPI003C26862A